LLPSSTRYIGDTVFDPVGQALKTVADSFGASGVVDGLTKAAARSAYEAARSTRDAAYCCAEL
jgi:hypothetical protein